MWKRNAKYGNECWKSGAGIMIDKNVEICSKQKPIDMKLVFSSDRTTNGYHIGAGFEMDLNQVYIYCLNPESQQHSF